MLKALLRKQFLELNSFYFVDRRTGKARTRGKTILTIVLFCVLAVYLCVNTGFMMYGMAEPLHGLGLDWFYFTLTGLVSLLVGTFGSVFTTYAGLYRAKDNDLLLSMPIPIHLLLASRLLGVFAMGMLWTGFVWIPSLVVRWMIAAPTVGEVILQLLLFLVIGLFVLVLTCLLGWVVAKISVKLKNRSFAVVILSLAGLGLFFYGYTKALGFVTDILLYGETAAKNFQKFLRFFCYIGEGATGEVSSFLIFAGVVLAAVALCCFVMTKTFLKIAITNGGQSHAAYRERAARAYSSSAALLRKEFRRLFTSPAYLLNSAIGVIFMPIVAGLAIYDRATMRWFADFFGAGNEGLMILIVAGVVCMMTTMIDITAPSISLEGKGLWIMRSLPVSSWEILRAKLNLHRIFALPFSVALTLILTFTMGLPMPESLLAAVAVALFVCLGSAAGLAINLKRPNLSWTNEMIPVKQSMSVTISIFGGWGVVGACGLIYYFLSDYIPALAFLGGCVVALAVATILLERWLRTRGVEIFEQL